LPDPASPALPPREADRLARLFAGIASDAGVGVMDIWKRGAKSRTKADRSPVSDADEQAEAIILTRLAEILPGVPVLAEEAAAREGVAAAMPSSFLLVDPVDGTRDFIEGGRDFTVNIALVVAGAPVAGCVFAPARESLWFGGAAALAQHGFVAGRQIEPGTGRLIATRSLPARPTVMVSHSHLDTDTRTFVETLGPVDRRSIGSSLKFCVIAEGEADIYPRFGPTMEWDTAAGHAVLNAAGGAVLTPDGAPFLYGKHADAYRNGAFIAWGRHPTRHKD